MVILLVLHFHSQVDPTSFIISDRSIVRYGGACPYEHENFLMLSSIFLIFQQGNSKTEA